MSTNPFDRVNLGYESLFGARTMFYHLQPNVSQASEGSEAASGVGTLVENLRVPVLDLEGTTWVEAGTVAAVVLGCMWVGWVLAGVAFRGLKGPKLGVNSTSPLGTKKTQ